MQTPECIVVVMSNKKLLKKLHRREARSLRKKQKSYGKEKKEGVKEAKSI